MSPVKDKNNAPSHISDSSSIFLAPAQSNTYNHINKPQNLSELNFKIDEDNFAQNLYGETDRLLNHRLNQSASTENTVISEKQNSSFEESISPTEKLLSEEKNSVIGGENENDQNINQKDQENTENNLNNSDNNMSEMLESVRYGYNQHLLASSKALETQYMNLIKDFKLKQKQALAKQKEKFTQKLDKETKKIEKSYETMYAGKMSAAATKMNAASKKLHEDYLHKKEILENKLQISATRCDSIEQELAKKRQILIKLENELNQVKHLLEKSQVQNKTQANCTSRFKSDVKKLEENNNKLKLEIQDLKIQLEDGQQISENLKIQSKNCEKKYLEVEKMLKNENKNLIEQVEELNEDVEILCASLQDFENFRKDFKTLQAENQNLTEKNGKLEEITQKLDIELTAANQNYDTLQNDLKIKISTKDQQIKHINADLSKLQISLKEAQCDQLQLTKKLEKKEKIVMKFENDFDQQNELIEKLKNEKDQLIESNHQLNDDIDNDRKRQSELNHKFELACNSKELEIERLKAQQKDTIEHLEKITNKLKEKVNDQEKLENQIASLQNEKIVLEQNYAALKAQSDNNFAIFQMKNLELKNQLDHTSQENQNLLNLRRQLETDLVNSASEKERAEHEFERQIRKFDFLQDEIQQIKALYEKERFRNETVSREHIILTDEVTCLRSKNEALISEIQVLESKCDKSSKNTQKIKEKVKSYKKNLSSAHNMELTHLKGTIEVLKNKLDLKENNPKEEAEKRKFQLKIDHLDTYVKTLEAKNQNLQEKLITNEKIVSPHRKKQRSSVVVSETEKIKNKSPVENIRKQTQEPIKRIAPESKNDTTAIVTKKSENLIKQHKTGRTKSLQNAQQIIAKHSTNFRKPLTVVDVNQVNTYKNKMQVQQTLEKIPENKEFEEIEKIEDQSIEEKSDEKESQTPLLKKIDHKKMATRSTRSSRRLIT